MPSRTFRDVIVWQKAHAFVLSTYHLSSLFPRHELFALTVQLRRAAISIPANIAEGFKKRGKSDKARFYNIAQGSLEEARYYLILAHDLGYADTRQLLADLEEVGRTLEAYTSSLVASSYTNSQRREISQQKSTDY